MYCLNIDVAQVVLESFVLLSRKCVCVGVFNGVCISVHNATFFLQGHCYIYHMVNVLTVRPGDVESLNWIKS